MEKTLDQIVGDAVQLIVERVAKQLAQAIAELTAEKLSTELQTATRPRRPITPHIRVARRPQTLVTQWVADRRARRVPNFVIEQTGLRTKREIIEKFGNGAKFEAKA